MATSDKLKAANYIFYALIFLHIGVPKICHTMVDESPGSPQHSPLSLAAQRGDAARVVELLNAGADPNLGLVAGPFGGMFGTRSPLDFAGEKGHAGCMVALLEAGADANQGGGYGLFGSAMSWSPLSPLSANGRTNLVALLLKAGADPNHRSSGGLWGLLDAKWHVVQRHHRPFHPKRKCSRKCSEKVLEETDYCGGGGGGGMQAF